MGKQIAVLLMGVALCGWVAHPAEVPPGFGAAAQFRLGVGARPLALGGAFVAASEGLEALYWNPAGLPSGTGSVGAMQLYPFAGGFGPDSGPQVQYIGASLSVRALGLGAGWFNVRVNDIPYVADDDILQYFNYDSSLLLFGGAVQVAVTERVVLRVGAAAKLYRESMLDASARGTGWDLGLLVDFGRFSLGYTSWDVLGTRYRWRGTGQEPEVEVPWLHQVGGAVRWSEHGLLATADLALGSGRPPGLRTGIEWLLVETFALRAGVRVEPTSGGGLHPVVSLGFGIGWELFVLDGAYITSPLPASDTLSTATYVLTLKLRF